MKAGQKKGNATKTVREFASMLSQSERTTWRNLSRYKLLTKKFPGWENKKFNRKERLDLIERSLELIKFDAVMNYPEKSADICQYFDNLPTNVFYTIPKSLHEFVKKTAKENKVSNSTIITIAILLLNKIGNDENYQFLLREYSDKIEMYEKKEVVT